MMQLEKVAGHNKEWFSEHRRALDFLSGQLERKGIDVEDLLSRLENFNIAIPSWALGTGGTRFGRFPIGGEPRNLEEKIDDVSLLHQFSQCSNAISLHIPWDYPRNPEATRDYAGRQGIKFDAVNSNTFQDNGAPLSYKFGSLSAADEALRQQAIQHNIEVIEIGRKLKAEVLSVWLSDGSSYPGQRNLSRQLDNCCKSLQEIYSHLSAEGRMLIEYKPFEPHFYSMAIPDWGTALLLAEACGDRASCLVDLGHHLPNTNIEQIVATLKWKGKLGGFHFNDSNYADDDLSVGSIKPYQLFLIMNELRGDIGTPNSQVDWMIDASHNLKDPLEDLLQSLEQIQLQALRALIVNEDQLDEFASADDPAMAEQILKDAFNTDLRPLLAEFRFRNGGSLNPLKSYRLLNIRDGLIAQRGAGTTATGL